MKELMKKRLLGILLSFALVLTMMPILGAFEVYADVDMYYWYESSKTTLHLSQTKLSNDYSEAHYTNNEWNIADINSNATKVVFENKITPTSTENWFNNFSKLETIEGADKLVTSGVTDMNHMFNNCGALQNLGVSNWKTSQVTNMTAMFNKCSQLTTLDVSNWDTSSVTSMENMFNGCSSMQTLDVSNWDTSQVTDMSAMFNGCSSMQTLDVSNWDTSRVKYTSSMFFGCSKLTTIYASEGADWNTITLSVSGVMFTNCNELVGGAGTTYDSSKTDKTYARVDGLGGEKGYFTVKTAPVETVTVKFDTAGGSAVADQTIDKGDKVKKPADPTRDGYTFDGWYLGSTAFDFSKPVEADIILVAHWKSAAQSTITYDLNGGTLNGETGKVTVKAENGSEITLPAPTRDGYTFDYWEGSKYYAGDKYKVNGDHTFKAVWKTADKGGSSDSDNKGGSSKKGVKTGDEQNVAGWITMMIASVLALAALAVKRKDILHR